MEKRKLVIIGSGPAACTAAIYAARANLEPLVFEGFMTGAGGQLMTTTLVENFPGFPDGIMGPELMDNMRLQMKNSGCSLLQEDVISVDMSGPFIVSGNKTKVEASSIIIATGATARRLDIEGTRDGEFWQRGVSACAICDGAAPIFRDKNIYVLGGGDSALEEAIFLTKFGKKVFIVHRRDAFRASKTMIERVLSNPKVEVLWNKVLVKVTGDSVVKNIVIQDVLTKEEKTHEAGGLFFAIGHIPNTTFLQGQLETDEQGYIIVKPNSCYTSVDGVFAAGDVHDSVYVQAVTAAGSGCMAALNAQRWLSEKGIE